MDKLIPRNNTSFIRSLEQTINNLHIDKNDILKYHQRIVHTYLLKYPFIRGILAYHGMGSGKTILSVSIIDSVIQTKSYKNILFISSKTLHGNFLEDYKKYLKIQNSPMDDNQMESYIKENCHFITLTANNMLEQIIKSLSIEQTQKLDDVFIVIDEAHNFFNGISNGSKNHSGLYELIMNAKKIKILFLTGSPITNDPFEIALCFNMLNGYYYVKHNNKNNKKLSLFGENYDDFKKYFILHPETLDVDKNANKIPVINNKEKFSNRIIGLVSYYGTDAIKNLIPKLLEPIIEYIPMSNQQYASYSIARDRELEETKKSFMTKAKPLQKPQGTSSSYRVRSRQLSNFLYPEYASNSYRDDNGYTHYEKFIDKLKPEVFSKKELDIYSPKLLKLLHNLSKHLPKEMLIEFKPKNIKEIKDIEIGPGIIYSQFIDSGIGLIAKSLEHYNMIDISKTFNKKYEKNQKGTFAIISGEIDPEIRTNIIKLAKSPDNKRGELLSLLLITATGAEGISTKYMKHVHAFEPFWHWSRLSQVFARAARLGSHQDLPELERIVQPYIYLSNYPSIFFQKNTNDVQKEETTDINLYHKSIQNQILIDTFLKTLKESSIDCLIHYDKNPGATQDFQCRKCNPTNTPLFIQDLLIDMKTDSPCTKLVEEKIKAKSISIEDAKGKREYMYYIKNEDIHIFQKNEDINAYQEIFEDNPDYFILSEKITKEELD